MVDSLGTLSHTIPITITIPIPITIPITMMIIDTLHPVAATRPHTLGAVIITTVMLHL